MEPQRPQIMPDESGFFTPKPSRNEEEFWDNQALLPGYQGVVVDTENNLSTQMLYNFLSTQINFKDEIVLDVGCGVGRLFPVFLNFSSKEVHGIDLSTNMIRVARFKFPQDNVYLYKQTASNLTIFTSNKFSLIISCTTLCHIIDQEEFESAINEIFRTCAVGGTIFICDPMSITANIHHEHSFMKTRTLESYQKVFNKINSTSDEEYLKELYCGKECFGPVDHIDSTRTVLVYRKL
jgi:ubiquinone/menaquinone biosynthesis C-methylase UbiE